MAFRRLNSTGQVRCWTDYDDRDGGQDWITPESMDELFTWIPNDGDGQGFSFTGPTPDNGEFDPSSITLGVGGDDIVFAAYPLLGAMPGDGTGSPDGPVDIRNPSDATVGGVYLARISADPAQLEPRGSDTYTQWTGNISNSEDDEFSDAFNIEVLLPFRYSLTSHRRAARRALAEQLVGDGHTPFTIYLP